ncbi:MAG: LLM class flavin-dependent oxidoreductase [Dehalococcoidia bacterium]|jgi:alkanesulfonate monooxygenase SsuD/methylene tetrahydromethanopterin reductase-like flavin-dependent oxidoreductase (luciferase family)|nr:LLM class flavin-dependent oxidoreductase [Dehalococcoidia bacterium]
MKISMFHLCPYRNLPEDFREKYRSVWVDVPRHLYDPEIGAQIYNDTLDELEFAARVGYDGVCVNEHHQNAYGLMPSPNIMAAALARSTKDVAVIVMGNSIALYDPPTRVAEEMAMLDGISGGRLVSGFPVGTSMDSNYCYGANPATFRDKYYEAEELIIKAWTEDEMFSFDGKYTQLRYVNLWPKPLQQPHPPVWVPGGGSIETWGWTVDKGYLYAYLSYSGFKRGKQVMDGFWKVVEEKDVEPNPYRAGFLQLVCVADSEQEAEERYGPAVEYFYNKMLHVYPGFADAPGYRTLDTIKAGLLAQTTQFGRDGVGELTWKDIVAAGNVVAGTPDQVTEQLEQVATDLRVGHLMLLNQIGSMPHDLAMHNIEKTATEVIPNLRHMWSGYEDHWWPQNTIVREPAAAGV